jgi:phage-related protein
MKTKTLFYLAVILISSVVLTFTSCAKEDLTSGPANTESLTQLSIDENNVENIFKDVEGDITSVLSNNGSGLKSTAWLPCNATVDSSARINDSITIYITYNGLTCNGKYNRTGKIEIKKKVGTHWEQAGATVICKYVDFTVTRISTGKSVKLNGTKTFVNVNGGHRWQVGTIISSYVERISGSMQAMFENGTSRTWNVARKVTYTGKAGQFIMTIDGFGSAGSYQNLVTWGTNRQDEEFYTQISQSIVCKQTCDWNATSGIKIHQIPSDNKSATLTFGYNDNNEPIIGNECPTRYRIDWQRNNKSGTIFLPL